MPKKYLKINETAFACIALVIIAIPFFASYTNKRIAEELQQKQQEKEAVAKGESAKFLEEYLQQESDRKKLEYFAKMYDSDPSNKENVHNYTYQLNVTRMSEKAFSVTDKCFKEAPKNDYWADIELWSDHAVASLDTKRCVSAIVDAWHINQNSESDSEEAGFSRAVMHKALNETGCRE